MKRTRFASLCVWIVALLLGCGGERAEPVGLDAGVTTTDAGLNDGGWSDAGLDAGASDASDTVACPETVGALQVPIRTAMVSGTLTLDGVPVATSLLDRGRVVLERLADERDRAVLADTRNADFSVPVVPGRYRLVYELANGGSLVPRNRRRVLQDEVAIDSDRRLDIDLASTALTVRVTLGGRDDLTSLTNNGDIVLASAEGDEAVIVNTRDVENTVRVLRGTYDVEYRLAAGGTTVPATPRSLLLRGVTLDEAVERLEVDVPLRRWTGQLTLQGLDQPTTITDRGALYLAGPSTEDDRIIATTTDRDIDMLMTPGTFDLVYRRENGGVVVPRNERRFLSRIVIPEGTEDFVQDIQIPRIRIEGQFSLNGAPPMLTPTVPAEIGLVDPEQPEVPIFFGRLRDGSAATTVLPGTYEVRYFSKSRTTQAPVNERGLLIPARAYDRDTTIEVDVPFVDVELDVTVDGAPPPTSVQGDVNIVLFEPDSGTTAILGSPDGSPLRARVMPGRYQVRTLPDGPIPLGWPTHAAGLVDGWSIQADAARRLDIPTRILSGAATLNGGPAPETTEALPALFFEAELDFVPLGPPAALGARVLPGTYDLIYASEGAVDGLPANTRARIGCARVR